MIKVLDLCCGAGGAAWGIHQALPDADITGVDVVPQKRYPFRFVLGDALTVPLDGYDFIWASPPCQFGSEATPVWARGRHPNLIPAIRARLQAANTPYIIENVEAVRKHLRNPIKLCGSMFGLPIERHRYFECQPAALLLTPPCQHTRGIVTIKSGSHSRAIQAPVLVSHHGDSKHKLRRTIRPRETMANVRLAMEIDWMVYDEITEAIPPAYSAFLLRQLAPLWGLV